MRRSVGVERGFRAWGRGAAALLLTLGLGMTGCGDAEGGPLQVLDLQPRAGGTQGEQPIRILGANFRQDIGYTVYFGGTRATQVTILDDTTLLVATPQHDAGRVDVVVAADDGPAFRIQQGFEFADQGGNVMQQVGESQGQGAERY